MNPATLKALCAAYHEVATSDLTVNSIDLFLIAANNAQKQAQLLHNFELTRVSATLDIDGITGGALSSAIISGDVNETLTVTGTLSPAATGTYTRQGLFSGYPFYINAAATSFFLYYNPNHAKYILASSLSTAAVSNRWSAPVATTVTGAYTAAGSNTGTAVVAAATSATWRGIREVVAVVRSMADGTRLPMDFTRADIPIERDRTARELSDFYNPRERYPSDADILNQSWNTSLIQRQNTIYVYPQPVNVVNDPISVILEAYATLPFIDVVGSTSDADPNFLWDYGASWLQWYIICELNYRFKTFVSRTEGNMPAPIEARDLAWQELIAWDSYLIDSNATRSR